MIELYTKSSCTYCNRAKNALRNAGVPFRELTLGEDFTKETLLERYSEAKTFPVVVVDGMYIGGYEELTAHIEELNQDDGRKLLTEGIDDV